MLSVPIPVAKAKEKHFYVNYWQESFAKPVYKIQLLFNSDTLVSDLKVKVKETLDSLNKSEGNEAL